MAVTILRWKGGAGGDTVLRLLMMSNPELQSQTRYVEHPDSQQSYFDKGFCHAQLQSYSLINEMALSNCKNVDLNLLINQLDELEKNSQQQHWMLKSHVYNVNIKQRIIDIVVSPELMPFVITANLSKNSRELGLIRNYHKLCSKISDKKLLYKFDFFNMARDLVDTKNLSQEQITVDDITAGWQTLTLSLGRLNLTLDKNCFTIYNNWLENNKKFMPSVTYQSMVADNNFDYEDTRLTVQERYCLLALSGSKFKILY